MEDATIGWLSKLGYETLLGPAIAFGESSAERTAPGYRDVTLERRLRDALARLNPRLPPEALEDAYRKLTRTDAPALIKHRLVAARRNA